MEVTTDMHTANTTSSSSSSSNNKNMTKQDQDPSTATSTAAAKTIKETTPPNSTTNSKKTPHNNNNDIPPRTYQPCATTYLETPLWSRILEPLCLSCLQPLLRVLCAVRGFLAPPFRTPIVPRALAGYGRFASLATLTVGDLVLLTPLVVFFLRGVHYTVVAPDVKSSGTMAGYCLYMCFLTASKSNAPFSFLLGISYDRLIGLHTAAAVCAAVLSGCHASVAYRYGDSEFGMAAEAASSPSVWRFLWHGQTYWSGTLLISSTMATTVLSLVTVVRRYAFQLWYHGHVLLGVLVLSTLFLHNVFSAVFVALWWGLDAFVRYGVLARETTLAELRVINGSRRVQDAGSSSLHHQPWEPAVELRIATPPGFRYNPGQFVRIAVPAIHPFEFHPISISSAPHQGEALTLHVRRLGDWTDKLVRLAEERPRTPVRMEGPYGTLSVDLEDDTKYKIVLCVSGGIGVTPCQSISKELLHQHRKRGRNLKKLRFVWAVRSMQMVHDIPPLLLEQEPKENYSTSSPEYARMADRSSQHFSTREMTSSGSFRHNLDRSARSFRSEGDNMDGSRKGLSGRRRPAVVQADIYCTRSEQDTEANSQGLPYNVHEGRPDLDRIFQDMKSAARSLGETNIAVIGCGPPSLMASLQEACRKHSASVVSIHKGGVFFDLHKERFSL